MLRRFGRPGDPERSARRARGAGRRRGVQGDRGVRRDRGATSIFVGICAGALVVVIGIVVDAGGRLRAIENTDARAMEAARVAGQQLDEAAVLQGQGYRVKLDDAQKAADAYLALYGLSGHVALGDGGTEVTVTVNTTYEPVLLSVVTSGMAVTGKGTATLVHGVKEAENG